VPGHAQEPRRLRPRRAPSCSAAASRFVVPALRSRSVIAMPECRSGGLRNAVSSWTTASADCSGSGIQRAKNASRRAPLPARYRDRGRRALSARSTVCANGTNIDDPTCTQAQQRQKRLDHRNLASIGQRVPMPALSISPVIPADPTAAGTSRAAFSMVVGSVTSMITGVSSPPADARNDSPSTVRRTPANTR